MGMASGEFCYMGGLPHTVSWVAFPPGKCRFNLLVLVLKATALLPAWNGVFGTYRQNTTGLFIVLC